MRYKVVLKETEEEVLANIREAIREYLEAGGPWGTPHSFPAIFPAARDDETFLYPRKFNYVEPERYRIPVRGTFLAIVR